MKLLKKLSVKSVCGVPVVAIGQTVPLMRVFGIITGTKTGTSAYGDWLAFVGQFRAEQPSGEQFASSVMLLPSVAQDALVAAMHAAQGEALEFILDILAVGVEPRAPGAAAYQYLAEVHGQTGTGDPLARLVASAVDLPRLGGPAAQTALALAGPEAPEVPNLEPYEEHVKKPEKKR